MIVNYGGVPELDGGATSSLQGTKVCEWLTDPSFPAAH